MILSILGGTARPSWQNPIVALAWLSVLPLSSIHSQRLRRLPTPRSTVIHDGAGTPLRTDPKYLRLSVAANGTIFLLQPYIPVIQRFSDNGSSGNEIGRKGSGPGEYLLPA